MRRGHPNRPGRRNDGPRHFRPRLGGPSGFRPPRPFSQPILETPRFPAPNPPFRPQFHGLGPFPGRGNIAIDIDERQNKDFHLQRGPRHFPYGPAWDPADGNHDQRYLQQKHDRTQANSMGDVDQRHMQFKPPNRREVGTRHINPWATDDGPNERHQMYDHDERRHYRRHRSHEDLYPDSHVQPPGREYSGHRPPASDHYENTSRTISESESFTKSVDDTVDLVRRKLINRKDPHSQIDEPDHRSRTPENQPVPRVEPYPQGNTPHTPKRRHHRSSSRHNLSANCNKIKNKIVNQLFKMDKEKIHKLMDNPNCSSKFEYAISSLVTESQNSLNRHMRAAAEKSLYGNRNDISQYNETDAIYDDTFMKQMQCILDPQDTVMLEDIKPFVLAELNKVLQLNELDLRHEHGAHDVSYPEPPSTHPQFDDPNYYEEHRSNYVEDQQTYNEYDYPKHEDYAAEEQKFHKDYDERPSASNYEQPSSEVLFERRERRKSTDAKRERVKCERAKSRESPERPIPCFSPEEFSNANSSSNAAPFFVPNTENLSEDEDYTFAELDQQYHVAIDRTYIETDDVTTSETNVSSSMASVGEKSRTPLPSNYSDYSSEKLSRAKEEKKTPDISPAKTPSQSKNAKSKVKKEVSLPDSAITDTQQKNQVQTSNKECVSKEKKENVFEKQVEIQKPDSSSNVPTDKSSSDPKSRKRYSEQRLSHRKEKRKKSDNGSSEQQILNKNIIINLNDCAKKSSDKCESTGKSIFNLFFSKGEIKEEKVEKEKRLGDAGKPENFDKYVKRKEPTTHPSKTSKEKQSESKKRSNSTSSNNSLLSPKESHTKDKEKGNEPQTPAKDDCKAKLKPIDIFSEKPKKPSTVHQAHRNTAPTHTGAEEPRVKTIPIKSISKQITKKSTGIQVRVRSQTKETQTIQSHKRTTRFVQTDPVSIKKITKKSTDAFERMKEIDMEIQQLLQEKFKLYNSLESKGQECPKSLQTLGMAVLNVNDTDHEDNVVDDFTNIPTDELEQIALESVREGARPASKKSAPISPKKTRRRCLQEQARDRSQSPQTNKLSRRTRTKTPNISLIEQIVLDDKPIEEIISLDDLEQSPPKTKQYKNKKKQRKNSLASLTEKQMKDAGCIPCSVMLRRENFEDAKNKLKQQATVKVEPKEETENIVVSGKLTVKTEPVEIPNKPSLMKIEATTPVLEEPTAAHEELPLHSEIHFQVDMLDVSEDIVIGDVCEVGKIDDKVPIDDTVEMSEDIVLDNSQSGDVPTAEVEPVESQQPSVCRTYDFCADEDLKHDSIACTGNGDAILAIECIDNNFLAASLDGNVYYFSGEGQLLSTLRGSNLAVTCLTIVKDKHGTTVYTGSLDSRIRYFDLDTGLEKGLECNVLSPIQTMDRAWDTVFVGTRTGFVLQFECKNNMLIPVSTVKFSEQSILALRALKEGPRKVLLVAARSESVTVKDAQTGLLLRTLDGPKMTVYTLLYEQGRVYCGTSSNLIQVFDYASGLHMGSHSSGKGAVCLRAAGGLILAGCYDGTVYLYRATPAPCATRTPLAMLRGPPVMLLSLALVGTKIIAGYKDRSLYIWRIPINILQEMVLD